jgi:hypothetical protein
MTVASEHAYGACLDARAKNLMNAITRHDVGRTAKSVRRICLHVHQIKKSEFPFVVIKEQVHVRSVPGLDVTARRMKCGKSSKVLLRHSFCTSSLCDNRPQEGHRGRA